MEATRQNYCSYGEASRKNSSMFVRHGKHARFMRWNELLGELGGKQEQWRKFRAHSMFHRNWYWMTILSSRKNSESVGDIIHSASLSHKLYWNASLYMARTWKTQDIPVNRLGKNDWSAKIATTGMRQFDWQEFKLSSFITHELPTVSSCGQALLNCRLGFIFKTQDFAGDRQNCNISSRVQNDLRKPEHLSPSVGVRIPNISIPQCNLMKSDNRFEDAGLRNGWFTCPRPLGQLWFTKWLRIHQSTKTARCKS